jgi:hypothetical protein
VWISKARIICAIHPQIPSHGDFYRETRGALVAASRIDAYAELLFGRLEAATTTMYSVWRMAALPFLVSHFRAYRVNAM